jgi:hypothetical protein
VIASGCVHPLKHEAFFKKSLIFRRKRMKQTNRQNIALCLAFFAALFFFIPCNAIAAEADNSEVSSSVETQLIEGKVKRFDPEKQTVLLQLKNRDKVTILLDWNTKLVGYESSKEIEKGHKVKIWYSGNGKTAKAVKIEKKIMVGC